MLSIGQIIRLFNIQRILIRYGLDEYFFYNVFAKPVSYMFYFLPWNWFRQKREPIAKRIRMALEALGPIYIKFGQLLSTRGDLLSSDIIAELSRLQDRVLSFPGKQAVAIIEQAYGSSIEDIFMDFDEIPLASASVAQVHSATTQDGKTVVVKVIRPDIDVLIRRDIGILRWLAEQFNRYFEQGRNLGILGVVKEFENTLLAELDLMREAANAAQLRRNFKDEKQFYVPAVHWALTRKNVLVTERIYGIPMSNIKALKEADIDLKWLAEYGVEIFFTQVFRDNFFHADMHPGNIFVEQTPDGPRVIVVDFGIMSSLTEFDQRYLAENFLAFLDRDYRKVALLHVKSGWVPARIRVDEFEFAIRTVCEPLLDKPLQDISFGDLLLRLFQTARQFNVEIMPQLILLQKTMVNIEGVARQLAPDLNPWETARPQLEKWVDKNFSVRGIVKKTIQNIPAWLNHLPDAPNNLLDLIENLKNNQLKFEMRSQDIKALRQELHRYHLRTNYIIIGSVLALLTVMTFAKVGDTIVFFGAPIFSWVIGGLAAMMLVLAVRLR